MKNKQFTAWSYSRLRDYQQCPFMAKLKYLDKIAQPPNLAMQWGSDVHEMAEGYIKGQFSRFPKAMENFKDLVKNLRQQYKKKVPGLTIEETWAFTRDWQPTVWNDWANCSLRIKVDAAHYDGDIFFVDDWKTGKNDDRFKDVYLEQIELFALGALLIRDVQIVRPRLLYIDSGDIFSPQDFSPADIPMLKKKWEKKSRPMLLDTKFAPRPNDRCCWCHYRQANKNNGGGQCQF